MSDSQSGRITYFLTQDMAEDLKKDKEVIREKWLELLVKRRMLQKLLDEARNISDANTRFHDFAHALEVLFNMHKLILAEGKDNFDRDILWAAALFHDASNSQKKEFEGKEGARIAESVLRTISDFPQDKIGDVKRLIGSINRDSQTSDEVLITTADEMAALSSLGLVRSLMISGNKEMKVKEALEWELDYIEKRFNRLRLESAKRLSERVYKTKKKFLRNLLKMYEE